MRPGSNVFTPTKSAFYCCAILALWFSLPCGMHAQSPSVPASFQPIYTELDNYLTNFNATLPPGSVPPYPTLMTASLKTADANNGPGLLNGVVGSQLPTTGGVVLQLNALKALGVKAIMLEIGFPMLYAPFLNGQNPAYQQQFTEFYQGVVAAIRQAG